MALTRPPRGEGRVIAGVCASIADETGLSVTIIRVLFVIAGFVGAGEIVYIIAWLLIPKR
jgi:phage shock protein C